jgi:hypothetical protein
MTEPCWQAADHYRGDEVVPGGVGLQITCQQHNDRGSSEAEKGQGGSVNPAGLNAGTLQCSHCAAYKKLCTTILGFPDAWLAAEPMLFLCACGLLHAVAADLLLVWAHAKTTLSTGLPRCHKHGLMQPRRISTALNID